MEEKRILVVEDERAIREMVVFTLKRAGFTVSEAEDASAARRALVDHANRETSVPWKNLNRCGRGSNPSSA